MRRLIWGFAGRTYHIVGNLMHWLICYYKWAGVKPKEQIGHIEDNTVWLKSSFGALLVAKGPTFSSGGKLRVWSTGCLLILI